MNLLLETRHQSPVGTMLYFREFAPCPPLCAHVACFWSGEISAAPHIQYQHRVLPDGCTDIIFNLQPDSPNAVVIGPMWRPRLVVSDGTPALGVRFYPGAALTFLGHSLSNLQERVVPLGEFHSAAADRLLDRLLATDGLARRVVIVEEVQLRNVRFFQSPPPARCSIIAHHEFNLTSKITAGSL